MEPSTADASVSGCGSSVRSRVGRTRGLLPPGLRTSELGLGKVATALTSVNLALAGLGGASIDCSAMIGFNELPYLSQEV
jgi:hypothetical protein